MWGNGKSRNAGADAKLFEKRDKTAEAAQNAKPPIWSSYEDTEKTPSNAAMSTAREGLTGNRNALEAAGAGAPDSTALYATGLAVDATVGERGGAEVMRKPLESNDLCSLV